MPLEKLHLPCTGGDDVADSGDWTELRVVGRSIAVYGSFQGCEVNPAIPNYLNAEQARQLFNWLGVWLHTGGK